MILDEKRGGKPKEKLKRSKKEVENKKNIRKENKKYQKVTSKSPLYLHFKGAGPFGAPFGWAPAKLGHATKATPWVPGTDAQDMWNEEITWIVFIQLYIYIYIYIYSPDRWYHVCAYTYIFKQYAIIIMPYIYIIKWIIYACYSVISCVYMYIYTQYTHVVCVCDMMLPILMNRVGGVFSICLCTNILYNRNP